MTNKKNKPQNVLRDGGHAFDGIQEYDNDMPRWWVNLFLISIVFGVGYLIWYHTPWFPSQSISQEYAEKKAERDALNAAAQSEAQAANADFDLTSGAQDPKLVAEGQEAFMGNCAACHAALGQGLVGPNLIDDFWIHGASYSEVSKIVTDGVAEKGMPGWGPILGPEKIKAVIVYIKTLQGSNPEGAKAAEGTPGTLH